MARRRPVYYRLVTSTDLWAALAYYDCSSRPAGEVLYYAIQPDRDGDRDATLRFWDCVTGAPEFSDHRFVAAFVKTARLIWERDLNR